MHMHMHTRARCRPAPLKFVADTGTDVCDRRAARRVAAAGDEAGAESLLYPPRFADGGVTQADFLEAMPKADLAAIFRRCSSHPAPSHPTPSHPISRRTRHHLPLATRGRRADDAHAHAAAVA